MLLLLSGKRDSNPRPRPWQGRALPTELFPQNIFTYVLKMRFELTRRNRHYPLKVACLPISPPEHLRAENGTRTRDPDLGKVVLYQLSYFRKSALSLCLERLFFKSIAKVDVFFIIANLLRGNLNVFLIFFFKHRFCSSFSFSYGIFAEN